MNLKKLITAIFIPLAVGGLLAYLTRNSMAEFDTIVKPPLSPPGWLFPIVWTILFVLMGIASYFVATSNKPYKSATALKFYGLQLIFNFFWSIIFFGLDAYLFAFIWIIILLLLIIITTILFYSIDKRAGLLMIPYILWVAFATYLNFAIFLLN